MDQRSLDMSLSRETLKLYWQATRKYTPSFVLLLISRPLYLAFTYIANVYITGIALDKLSKGGPFDIWQDFGGIILGLIGFALGQLLFEYISVRTIWIMNSKVQRDLALLCYNRLMNESADFHANRFAGSIVSQTNKFISGYDRLLETLHWQVYALIINIVFALILLAPRIPLYTFILFVLLTFYFVVSIVFNKKARMYNAILADAENKGTGQLADSIGNIIAVKSYSAEAHEQKRYEARQNHIFDSMMRLRKYTQTKDLLISIPITGSTILAITFSIIAANNGVAPLSTLLLATVLTRDLFMRAREFNVNSQRSIAKAFGDAHDITGILLSETKVIDKTNSVSFKPEDASLEFDNVTFKYIEKKHEHLFKNLSFKLKSNEKLGLVGPSGGGKSTITKLILRFMDIHDGAIKIGAINIAEVPQKTLREHISYVPQEPLLFHRTLAENIRYGNPHASEADVVRVAKLAHAHEFIQKLPEGYETMVGERGVKLSGGQKQRIAIARAMLKDSPILILDEATSALDSESESAIQDALKTLMEGKTTIVIAHRLSTIQKMDRIIVLDEGKIVEEGTHKSLVKKKNGLYARLWTHQSGGFLQD